LYEKIKYLEVIERMEAIIKRLNSMVVKGGDCQCFEKNDKRQVAVNARKMVEQIQKRKNQIATADTPTTPAMLGGAKSKRAKLEKMKVARLQKMAVSKGIKITKKKDGKTVYLKKSTIVNKLLHK
jgi:hypothetical protein